MAPDQDWGLIQRFQSGEITAFEEIFRKYQVLVLNLAFRFVRGREAAEDIAQDIFLKIYRKKIPFDPRAKFSTWLYRVTVNASLDALRKRKYAPMSLSQRDTPSDGEGRALEERLADPRAEAAAKVLDASEREAIVQREIGGLPEKLRVPILLYQFEEMPYREIAQILDISEKAVERRIYHAKEILKNALEGYL